MRGCAAIACTSRSAPWVSTSACSGIGAPPPSRVDPRVGGALQVGHAARLGDHQVGQPVARLRRTMVDHLLEQRVVDRQHPHADAAEAVVGAVDQLGDQVRLLDLAADRRAVLAVERDVEHRAQLGLQRRLLRMRGSTPA
jgi:hypothetical protein